MENTQRAVLADIGEDELSLTIKPDAIIYSVHTPGKPEEFLWRAIIYDHPDHPAPVRLDFKRGLDEQVTLIGAFQKLGKRVAVRKGALDDFQLKPDQTDTNFSFFANLISDSIPSRKVEDIMRIPEVCKSYLDLKVGS